MRFLLAAILCCFTLSGMSQDPPKKQFLYKLTLPERLQTLDGWTDKDNQITGLHFQHLQKLQADGKLILAGRTDEALDQTFGIVIFEAENLEAATKIMKNDPAVKEGIMIATLHPYRVALIRESDKTP